jgi:hypothetical protein
MEHRSESICYWQTYRCPCAHVILHEGVLFEQLRTLCAWSNVPGYQRRWSLGEFQRRCRLAATRKKKSFLCWKSKINKKALHSHCTNSAVAHYNITSKSDSRLEDITFTEASSSRHCQSDISYKTRVLLSGVYHDLNITVIVIIKHVDLLT